ncbi:MAG: type I-C CRISPR-associated protein Cas7/Csd2 [Candidatus Nitricoxidivorans perseverans]|uniref:Type I-C CRISPR-associated protein Cas7/Csd2 n=1 Tax=Candidatus Nitricoxidivorans perseverans TaxID=2975601 RepID=A0AA49IZZ5_9PROT|nr:MAG: type I-C CRISPR-associated protein Cas7/Csd2 [Candidatus Nitricoxidivorans perseverans]
MTALQNKIDFAIVLRVKNANPNGDPLNGNRPRTDYGGLGEITDVCLKRKLRDRLQEAGYRIYVQSDDRKNDEHKSLAERARAVLGDKLGGAETAKLACGAWFDVRAFGQLFAIKAAKKTKKAEATDDIGGDTGISVGIRGPVSIQSAFSLEPVSVTSTQITKSVSGEGDGSKRGSDTMGMKHRVDHGIYVSYGSMNPQLAERTGFSGEDAAAIKAILPKLFENDASSARPEGSMEVVKVVWWQQEGKGKCSSAKVHASLDRTKIGPNGEFDSSALSDCGVVPEVIEGF